MLSTAVDNPSMHPRPVNKRAGLTLLEVMIGFAVLTIVSGSILAGLLQGRRLADQNLCAETAFATAQSYLEELKAISYNELTTSSFASVRGGLTNNSTAVRLIDMRGTPGISSDDLRVELTPSVAASPSLGATRPVVARNIVLTYRWRKQGEPAGTERIGTLRVIRANCSSF